MELTLNQAVQWMSGELAGNRAEPASCKLTSYSIDTRTLTPGALFFAVKGDRFDGHDFLQSAAEQGAVAAVVSRPIEAALPQILVGDPLLAMQELAHAVRAAWGRRVIGITGSAGKTTTKEAVATVLAARYNVLKSAGNLNNHFGVPLQLLRLESQHEVAVIEMGMSHSGEIARLCEIAVPDWGVVTNVGHAHAENFADGVAGVARAKYELPASLAGTGVAFLNGDDPCVSQFGRNLKARCVYFGRGACTDPRLEELEGSRVTVRAGNETKTFTTQMPGAHNISNALAAIAVGLEAGIPLEACCRALETLTPGNCRGEVIKRKGARIINDAYNSNPEAMKAMIAVLAATPATRRILVAGEMLELGPESPALHRACGEAAARAGVDIVVGVRGLAAELVAGAAAAGVPTHLFATPEEAGAWMNANLGPGDAVLLKASRGVRLERALEVH